MNKMWVWFGFPAGIGVLLLFMVVMSGESARADGLKFVDLTVGEGRIAKKGDTVTVAYVGTLVKNGRVFDTQKEFRVKLDNQMGELGWKQGIEGMREGGEREITTTSEIAFGPKSQIPPRTELRFKVSLLEIE